MPNPTWTPPSDWTRITTIDAHAAGEPLRVITAGLPPIPGDTILAKRRYARENLDHIRRALMFEPRGHADMYGAILTDPVTADGDLGVLFIHNEGYSSSSAEKATAVSEKAKSTGYTPSQDSVSRSRARCLGPHYGIRNQRLRTDAKELARSRGRSSSTSGL